MNALVVRLGGFGGVLLTGPAVRAVATRAGPVTVLCGPRGAPAARLLPHADDVLVAEDARQGADPPAEAAADTDRLLRHLREGSYDVALDLTPSHRSPLPAGELLGTARVPRVGVVGHIDSPARRPQGRHEAEAALQTAADLGFSLRDGDDGRLRVVPSPDTAGLTGNGPYVVVHPGAGTPNRAWDPDGCAEAVALLADAGHRVVVTGGPHETALTRYVSGGTAVDLGGRTDARTLAGVVRAADVVVTGSTAPAQLAAATGTPVVSVRSPLDPRRRPYGVPGVLLGDETGPRADTGAHPDLNEITAHDVLRGVQKLLQEGA
ncbi:glycosyltransferase family 9 protein [Streptomyces sp. NPDC051104]|uniref:glycosyltransferase family 9 protein n=1 Tax=Streptomyces sp. NPDC051104 TaxID=3155044 RepID=UPI0034317E66